MKIRKAKKNWDLTFKYNHDIILSNPLIDNNGHYFYVHKTLLNGKRVKVYTNHQRKYIKRLGGVPI